jgi:glycosyltransferase involved in cell wall biosynthesis
VSTQSLLWINHFAVPPTESGGTRHFEIGRELVGMGWQVEIAASDYNYQRRCYTRRIGPADRSAVDEIIDGVHFRWLWSSPYAGNNWRRAWNWMSFARAVAAPGAVRRADIVIGSSPHLFAAYAGLKLARRWNVPFVMELRDLWPESLIAAGGRKGAAYTIFHALARYLYRNADRIVCLARGTMRQLESYGVAPEKLVYVPNGAHVGNSNGTSRATSQFTTLVYAGAHGPANGLDVVVEAADRLRDRPDIRFILIGDGPAKSSLVADANARKLTNIEFRNPIPKAEVADVLAAADAGLMILRDTPLFSYGVSPNKLFDYFAASLPVICNVNGEVAGMLRAARGGEQAADGSAAALADAITRFSSRAVHERLAMGQAGREWVEREHSRPVLARRLDAVLRELTAR